MAIPLPPTGKVSATGNDGTASCSAALAPRIAFSQCASAETFETRGTVNAMRFTFPHSHAFSGGQLTVQDDAAPGPSCMVEFGDGTMVIGELANAADGHYDVNVPDYKTAKGHTVKARSWRIARRGGEGVWRSMRIA